MELYRRKALPNLQKTLEVCSSTYRTRRNETLDRIHRHALLYKIPSYQTSVHYAEFLLKYPATYRCVDEPSRDAIKGANDQLFRQNLERNREKKEKLVFSVAFRRKFTHNADVSSSLRSTVPWTLRCIDQSIPVCASLRISHTRSGYTERRLVDFKKTRTGKLPTVLIDFWLLLLFLRFFYFTSYFCLS